jgi:FkbM family methyltransferase
MIPKRLAEITEDDLLALISNGVAEGRVLEYKRDLPGNSDGDKKEFLADSNSKSAGHLKRHLALNGCTNVTVEPLGLMDVEQELEFYRQAGESSWNSSFVREFVDPNHEVEPTRVRCTTLDAYVARTGLVPQLIKIDTEGTEFFVLRGATQLMQQHRPKLLMEFNPASAEKAGTSIPKLHEYLTSLRYRLEVIPAKRYGGYDFRRQVPFSEDVPTLEGAR